MIKCKCGRVKKYGQWVRPIGDDLRQIQENYDRIIFKDDVCDKCRVSREGADILGET